MKSAKPNTIDSVTLETINAAKQNIADLVNATPLKYSSYLSQKLNKNVYLKLENLNITGSFKIRGATNALKNNLELAREKGVIASSAGNHAQGVAYICNQYKVPATIFMPKSASFKKRSSTEKMGARVVLAGEAYDECYAAALEFAKKDGGYFLHPFNNVDVVSGQGTIGLELLEQMHKIDAVVIPIGGGGLISGIACAIKLLNPKIKVIGVQTFYYPAMLNKFAHLQDAKGEQGMTIADGIAVKGTSDLTCQMVEKYVDDIVLVKENEISSAILTLMEHDAVLAEGAGAAATAALATEKSLLLKNLPTNSNVVSIVSGGNIDISLVSKVIARALYLSGRLMRLKVKIKDQPGNLIKLLKIFADENVNILEITHNRVFSAEDTYVVECDIDIETVTADQQTSVQNKLTEAGYQFSHS